MRFFLALLLSFSSVFSQTEKEVKLSNEFYWGEASSEDPQSARSDALRDMMMKISVTLSASSSLQRAEDYAGADERYRSEILASSAMTLSGVAFLESERRGLSRVIAYISKADYQTSLKKLAESLQGDARTLELREQNSGPLAALSDYYLLWLKTHQSPETVPFTTADGTLHPNLRLFLMDRMSSVINHLNLECSAASIDADLPLVTLDLRLNYQNRPLSGLIISPDSPDRADVPVTDGRAQAFIYALPSARIQRYPFVLRFASPAAEKDRFLRQVHENLGLSWKRSLELDLSDQIFVDMIAEKQRSGAFVFKPVFRNLSISSLLWDFGHGQLSDAQNPLIRFSSPFPQSVTLRLNNDPHLSVTRLLSEDGSLKNPVSTPDALTTSPKPSPAPAPASPAPASPAPASPAPASNTRSHLPPLDDPVLIELRDCPDYDSLSRVLARLRSTGRVVIGNPENFLKPEACYVSVIKPASKEHIAFLSPDASGRINLRNGSLVRDIPSEFRGMISIYMEFK